MEVDSSFISNNGNDTSEEEEKIAGENEGNAGLANALAKVISMSKKKRGKSIVLSKAKLYNPNQQFSKKTEDFEIEPNPNVSVKIEEDDEENTKNADLKENKKLMKKRAIKKQEKLRRGRLKPSPLDREKEKPLIRIATKGVVQLFNAVRQHQTKINKEINKRGVTEGKKEKILKNIDKNTFLEVLRGKKLPISETNGNDESNCMEDEIKEEHADAEEPSWQVLRDDFMMGAKLKDWDKNETEVKELVDV